MEKRYQDKDNELLSYKEKQMSKPEVKLEAELSLLRVEKVGFQSNILNLGNHYSRKSVHRYETYLKNCLFYCSITKFMIGFFIIYWKFRNSEKLQLRSSDVGSEPVYISMSDKPKF